MIVIFNNFIDNTVENIGTQKADDQIQKSGV